MIDLKKVFVHKWTVPALVILVAAGMFLWGRLSAPTKVVTINHTEELEKLKEQMAEVLKKLDTKTTDTQENKSVHTERTEEIRPDGTKFVKVVTDTNINRVIKEIEVKFVDRTTTVEKEVTKEVTVEITKIVESKKPDWTVTARAGIDNKLLPVVGLGVDRRILGPFKAGLWANSNTQFNSFSGGLSVSVEF